MALEPSDEEFYFIPFHLMTPASSDEYSSKHGTRGRIENSSDGA